MRIYALVEYYPNAYKAYYDTQFADLVRKGHDLHIFAIGCLDSVVDNKVLDHRLDQRTRYCYPDDLRSLTRFAPRLAHAIAASPRARISQVINAFSNWRGPTSAKDAVKAAARMLTLPAEPPDFCLVNSHRTMALLPWLRALYPGVPVALYYYGGEPQESGRLDDQRTNTAFAAADQVFALTQFARDEAIDRGADPDRTFVIPIGFDINDYQPTDQRAYRRGGVLNLVSAGRLSEGKGHVYALEAIARLVHSGLRDIEYRIIGSGYMRPRLDEFVVQNGLSDYVRFDGTLANRDLIAAMGQSDALVLPSIPEGNWTETQGAVVQEALLMKAVTITTQTGGVPESIPAVMRPFSVPAGDVDSLAASIERVSRLPATEFQRLGQQGRRWAVEHYDIATLNDRLLELAFDN